MNGDMKDFDVIDLRILTTLQRDSSLSQREVAERVGLSQNACWRRIHALQAVGILAGSQARVDLAALGLDLTVFVMIRTRHHSREWIDRFSRHVQSLPEVLDFNRIALLRTASNFDREAPGTSPAASLSAKSGGFGPSTANAYRVAGKLADDVIGNWAGWEKGVPAH